jgi:hypothetical protein
MAEIDRATLIANAEAGYISTADYLRRVAAADDGRRYSADRALFCGRDGRGVNISISVGASSQKNATEIADFIVVACNEYGRLRKEVREANIKAVGAKIRANRAEALLNHSTDTLRQLRKLIDLYMLPPNLVRAMDWCLSPERSNSKPTNGDGQQ